MCADPALSSRLCAIVDNLPPAFSPPSLRAASPRQVLTVFTTTQVKPTPVTPAPVPANMYPAQVIEGYPAWQFKAQCSEFAKAGAEDYLVI